MLLIECIATRAAKAGANIAEVKEIGKRTEKLSNSQIVHRPILASVYLDGMPLGENPQLTWSSRAKIMEDGTYEEKYKISPIPLEAGDHLLIADLFPKRVVFEVIRDSKLLWAEKDLHAQEEAREARVAEKLEARVKAGI